MKFMLRGDSSAGQRLRLIVVLVSPTAIRTPLFVLLSLGCAAGRAGEASG